MRKKIKFQIFKEFAQSAYLGSMLLFLCVIVSLVLANSVFATDFQAFLDRKIGFENDTVHLNFSIENWINDGFMAVFFLLVGLEIKRELIGGELSSVKKAVLPIMSAFGGAVVPALIYLGLNFQQDTVHGWGIPMATDIAFALAVLSLLGNKIPISLKIFLTALAIVDDLIAILVIAIFYSTKIHVEYLLYASVFVGILVLLNRLKVKRLFWYMLVGLVVWYLIHHSGIHATIAGVIVAFTIPTKVDTQSPLEKLEHLISNPVNFLIVPLFALANTNITYVSGMFAGLFSPLGLGIFLGLLVGKTIGISLTCFLATKFKIATLPEKSTWSQIIGVGLLAGIGFTMSIFVSLLSFEDATHINEAKFAILITSLTSGFVGYWVLNRTSKRLKRKNAQ